MKIPTENSKEDIKNREKIISDVYRKWYKENPTKKVFNSYLRDNTGIKKTENQSYKGLAIRHFPFDFL